MSFGFDLDLLKTYAAVVDSGGFTKAAERVHLTQSTVSQQIKKLEGNFGTLLLRRDKSTGTIETTEAGELLLSYARRLLATAEEAAEVMRKPSAPRTVRLGVPEDFAGRRLIDLLTGFSAASPTYSTGCCQRLERGTSSPAGRARDRSGADQTRAGRWALYRKLDRRPYLGGKCHSRRQDRPCATCRFPCRLHLSRSRHPRHRAQWPPLADRLYQPGTHGRASGRCLWPGHKPLAIRRSSTRASKATFVRRF